MKVSCIMPTANRRPFIPAAIGHFLAQDYDDKELIILDDGEDCVGDLVPSHPHIRYLRHNRRQPLGRKRNMACAEARGELIAHWDDDDWYASFRLRRQIDALLTADADICGIDHVLFLDAAARKAWEYVYPRGHTPWVCGATLCYRKSFWRKNPFPEINVAEDTRFVFAARGARIEVMPDTDIFVGMIHRANTSPKRMRDSRWRTCPIEVVEAVMRPQPLAPVAPTAPAVAGTRPAALVTAASGIGDIIRATPLVRVLHRLGYDVDLLIAPDDPACLDLFRGAPELRRVIHCPGIAGDRGPTSVPELADESYALATFTAWSRPLAGAVKAQQQHMFEPDAWRSHGDIWSVEKIARALGWRGPLPEPFVRPSGRAFDLPAGTIALHPGCKPEWPWKKWHGFDALARLLPHVVIVGTASDLDNSGTYFSRAFEWPAHAQNFVGKLGLADTAALIGQCAALVANDSGLMHLGVALGIPTFGIFGITSPQRELIPSPVMNPITKQLPCEAACRRMPWGRRDCERHLACLKTLTAQEVAARVHAKLPKLQAIQSRPIQATETVRLNYYGYVFDASGYGQAARAYIHALHTAGVKVSVIDIGAQPAQTEDALVTSLLGCDNDADFNLFHGIPSSWARTAQRLRNVIAMTVWETDTMPQQWRGPLSRAIDVWLPCQFNVEVFSRELGRPVFRLPHAVPPLPSDGACAPASASDPQFAAAGDFVFYSIFEWQDRKTPGGMMEAFLRAFPEATDAILVLKTNPGAAEEAKATLQRIRAATRAHGRIILCCEAWSEARVRALHQRGDCYVSLHKGEGWGYPLFEAAARGKPVVATDHSGPRDYLDRKHHWLVQNAPRPVRQRYQFYQPYMTWAEPDIGHAAQGLRWIYENRDSARAGAAEAARRITADFSIASIGALAKTQLLHLLEHRRATTAASADRKELNMLRTSVPIPGDWFDDGYFERGLKSNWNRGYTWPLFEGVFRDAAGYLVDMFPEARTFLDIGCAKGFLVRTLRERGLEAWGFDHSPWAISHADAIAKPFLQLADVGTAQYDRQFDVLVAMSVLESLSEEQISAFLPHARRWAGKALLAVIPTTDGNTSATSARPNRDLSRITLRDRDWWRAQFIAAGWKHDAPHRAFEQQCQEHGVATKMAWTVHVFSANG
jgi:ADP-heptose:LPS heptosyltransferase